jgi:hypothetical protein
MVREIFYHFQGLFGVEAISILVALRIAKPAPKLQIVDLKRAYSSLNQSI